MAFLMSFSIKFIREVKKILSGFLKFVNSFFAREILVKFKRMKNLSILVSSFCFSILSMVSNEFL